MEKVVILNLNGRAYQLDESGYTALKAYLDRASVQLKDNPDRAEILADLEQAIAEKCQGYLNPHKTVVTGSEVAKILADMGPVRDAGAENAEASGEPAGEKASGSKPEGAKKLYQIRDGAVFSGVCKGLAAYLNIEVVFVRLAFLLGVVAFPMGGFWILAYLIMTFTIPVAETPEERAAAHGARFSAQALIDQGKLNVKDLKEAAFWKHRWDRQRRYFEERWRRSRAAFSGSGQGWFPASRASQVFSGLLRPFVILATVGLSLVFALTLASLVIKGAVLNWTLPQGVPLWVAILVLVLIFQVLILPLQALRYTPDPGPEHPASWPGAVRMQTATWALSLILLWALYTHVPQVRDFLQKLPQAASAFVEALTKQQG